MHSAEADKVRTDSQNSLRFEVCQRRQCEFLKLAVHEKVNAWVVKEMSVRTGTINGGCGSKRSASAQTCQHHGITTVLLLYLDLWLVQTRTLGHFLLSKESGSGVRTYSDTFSHKPSTLKSTASHSLRQQHEEYSESMWRIFDPIFPIK